MVIHESGDVETGSDHSLIYVTFEISTKTHSSLATTQSGWNVEPSSLARSRKALDQLIVKVVYQMCNYVSKV